MPLTLFCPCCSHPAPAPDGGDDHWAWCPFCGAEYAFQPPHPRELKAKADPESPAPSPAGR